MTAPERIWIDAWGGNWSPQAGGTQGVEYIRADLAAVQPAQVKPDCCDICRGGTFAETSDGKGWRCVECKAIWLRADLEPQPDPRDEVIKGLVEALEGYKSRSRRIPFDLAVSSDAALASAKAVQHD